MLSDAAFVASDKATALARIETALKSAENAIARNPGDHDARLHKAMALSYRGKLTRSRADLAAARQGIEAVISAQPRNAEAQMALAGWHLGAVIELGPLLARTMLGARKATGLEALGRSVALGGDRAFYPAVASLHQVQLDPANVAEARRLAQAAVEANAVSPIDRQMQKQAAALLPLLRPGNGKAAAQRAKSLLPFGQVR